MKGINELRRFSPSREFFKISFSRVLTGRRLIGFIIFNAFILTLLLVVTASWSTLPLRLILAGCVFALSVVGSIVFGLPAGILAAIGNFGGIIYTLQLFRQSADWYHLSIAVFQMSAGISSLIIAILSDMEKNQKEVHRQASLTDALTEVYNNRFFHLRLDEELTRAERGSTRTSLLLIDVNSFKFINDNYGHAVGDRVLKDVAVFITQSTRASDIVCRYGGDEFAVILPDTDSKTANSIAKRVAGGLSAYLGTASEVRKDGHISLSIGAATYPDDAKSRLGLIEHADKHLYSDKRKFYESQKN